MEMEWRIVPEKLPRPAAAATDVPLLSLPRARTHCSCSVRRWRWASCPRLPARPAPRPPWKHLAQPSSPGHRQLPLAQLPACDRTLQPRRGRGRSSSPLSSGVSPTERTKTAADGHSSRLKLKQRKHLKPPLLPRHPPKWCHFSP
ncbi:uncharacterized protein LOC129403557 isoform X1 [Sorex araneus]|uniref:uncharacterized protein LOC129403557 isoform X1 n=1 Tax=Sorex araneus TaxID=42254 RepID=UPI002433370F|nr:uncharacterized protein LOC129403557 isoform X1 [Sorex araneus]